jgi:dUTP pyrophosphatase
MFCQKLTKNAVVPEQKTNGSAGYDLYTNNKGTIKSQKQPTIVTTGIAVKIPKGYVGIIKSRSGLSAKHGIEVGAGVIDSDYTGELKVILYNHGDEDFKYKENTRIAQMIIIPTIHTPFREVRDLEQTERGSSGFGSTGLY